MSTRITNYVKTPEEVEQIKSMFVVRRYDIERLAIDFETTAEYVRAVLPPCFEPAAVPTGSVRFSRALSASGSEWSAAVVDVRCSYDGVDGSYCILMHLTGDMPVTIGREFWGEIKKRAEIEFFRGEPYIYSYCRRNGVKLLEADGELGADRGPRETSGHAFELKASISADMQGLQYDPLVVVSSSRAYWNVVREADVDVTVRGTAWDPIDEVPMTKFLGAQYCLGHTESETIGTYPVGPADAYLPYVWGRNFDDPRCDRVPRRYRPAE